MPLRPASAQEAARAANTIRPSAEQLAATARLFAPTVPVTELAGPLVTTFVRQDGSRRQGMAFMLVGAAGILTGLIIDEPVITILSAGLGGAGLYLYVR